MRFDASSPVCYVRLYRLCSLVPSPVFNHIFAFLSVLICPYLSSSVFSFLSVLISQSRHLSPSPRLPVCSLPSCSALNFSIQSRPRTIRTFVPTGRFIWTKSDN